MTERSWFWGGITTGDAALPAPYGAPYSDKMFGDVVDMLINPDRTQYGVVPTLRASYTGMLAVTNPAGLTLRVASGVALVNGKIYASDANVDLTATIDGTYYVVLRETTASQTVRLVLLTPGTSVTQNDGVVWELSLAMVIVSGGAVASLIDTRNFIGTSSSTKRLWIPPSSVYRYTSPNYYAILNYTGFWELPSPTASNQYFATCNFAVPSDYGRSGYLYMIWRKDWIDSGMLCFDWEWAYGTYQSTEYSGTGSDCDLMSTGPGFVDTFEEVAMTDIDFSTAEPNDRVVLQFSRENYSTDLYTGSVMLLGFEFRYSPK